MEYGLHHGRHHDVQGPRVHGYDYLSHFDVGEKHYEDDKFFEDMFGYGDQQLHDMERAHSEMQVNRMGDLMDYDEDESNDIQFKINDDVEFTLSTDDNYRGRDIQVGVELPDGYQGQPT